MIVYAYIYIIHQVVNIDIYLIFSWLDCLPYCIAVNMHNYVRQSECNCWAGVDRISPNPKFDVYMAFPLWGTVFFSRDVQGWIVKLLGSYFTSTSKCKENPNVDQCHMSWSTQLCCQWIRMTTFHTCPSPHPYPPFQPFAKPRYPAKYISPNCQFTKIHIPNLLHQIYSPYTKIHHSRSIVHQIYFKAAGE